MLMAQRLDGQKAGTFGDVGCFSFYPTKVMTSCEGGMIITNNETLADASPNPANMWTECPS